MANQQRKLKKTTIVIWSEAEAPDMELIDLAWQAERGESHCSVCKSEIVPEPDKDPDWDGTEFFAEPEDPTAQ